MEQSAFCTKGSIIVPDLNSLQPRRESVLLLVELSKTVKSSHTAGTGRGDGLSVLLVLNITGSINERNRGLSSAWDGLDVAALVGVQLRGKHLGGRDMANGIEETVDRKRRGLLGVVVNQVQALQHLSVTLGGGRRGLPQDLDLLVVHGSLLHDGRGTQHVSSDEHVHLRGVLGQEQGLLTGRVSTSHNSQRLVTENGHSTITNSTGRDTLLPVLLLAREVHSLGRSTGGNDHGVGGDGLTVLVPFGPQLEWSLRQVALADGLGDDLSAKTLALLAHVVHELCAGESIGETREVLDLGGGGQLATGGNAVGQEALVHHGLSLGTSEVDGGGVGGGAGTNNGDFVVDHS